MKKIDLVFRTVGERTSKVALDLAIKNIQPNQVHVIENVKPFSLAVQQMLRIDYDCDFVVFMDADCLIIEDMNPFLQENILPYIDCYVLDKFRGYIHCGVHIVRRDVVRAMQAVKVPQNDSKYVLRPESRIRDLAMSQLNLEKVFKPFDIFHDFCQFYRDIFVKYALRELRSRTDYHQAKLNAYQEDWEMQAPDDLDFRVAKYAIAYARETLKENASGQATVQFIKDLPQLARHELSKQEFSEKKPLTLQEVENLSQAMIIQNPFKNKTIKFFGIGLSRTGNKSLILALNMLGFKIAHYPDDEITLKELMAGKYDFSILNDFDGITDITVAPYYAQLDKLFPDSKFILTVRDKDSWLKSVAAHFGKPVFEGTPSNENTMLLRRQLRVAVYGSYSFNEERFSYVYDLHCKNVIEYYKDRPGCLLIINIFEGEGWDKLCSFLNLPVLDKPFPFMTKKSELRKIGSNEVV
jgi:glycosyltransferase involved in cell wall biosynthesis